MQTYLVISTVTFFFFAFIWTTKTSIDTTVKFLFFSLGSYGAFLLFSTLGYIVKV